MALKQAPHEQIQIETIIKVVQRNQYYIGLTIDIDEYDVLASNNLEIHEHELLIHRFICVLFIEWAHTLDLSFVSCLHQ